MANKPILQKPQTILENQPKQKNEQKTHGDVRQDMRGAKTARSASPQAARFANSTRAVSLNTKPPRVRNYRDRARTVQLTIWVTEPISRQVNERARDLHITRSTAGLDLLRRGLTNDLFRDYEQMIAETIHDTIGRELNKRMKWRDSMLVRILYYTAQTCTLAANLVCLLLDTEPKTRDAIMEKSGECADEAVKQVPSHIIKLMKDLAKQFKEKEDNEA